MLIARNIILLLLRALLLVDGHDRFVSGKEMQGARVLIDNHIITLIKNAAWKFSTPARPHPVLFRVSGLHTLSNRIVLPSPRHAKQAIAEPLPWKCGEA